MTQIHATFMVGSLAALIAIWGILTQRQIARRRATFDHISKSENDPASIAARKKFIELAKRPGGLPPWAGEGFEHSDEAQVIKLVLNDFELIAIGIQRGIIDEEFYRRWFKSGVVRHWNYAEPFVRALRQRTGNEALFHEFEQLAIAFRKDNKPPPRNNSLLKAIGCW